MIEPGDLPPVVGSASGVGNVFGSVLGSALGSASSDAALGVGLNAMSSGAGLNGAPLRAAGDDAPMPLERALEGPERKIIERALERHGWSRQATADELAINRTTLYKKMRKYRLDGRTFDAGRSN